MNRVLAYAKERGIGIIPLINSPGHMDSILKGMEVLGMEDVRFENNGKKSERTVNLLNADAVAFTKELVKKYAVYFGNSGACEIFNFGADEYANDVFTNPGWGELQRLNLYDKFINYANGLAGVIKEQGMKPVCFNDGIYYNGKDEYGTFDKDIIISYWTAGWWGFYVANPSYLANKGHAILNTNDAWYWVLGNVETGGYHYNNTIKNIEAKGFDEVTGARPGENIPTIGSMQAVWCDNPSAAHDMERIFDLMDRYSTKHADKMIRPADYTKVDEALEKVPADLSIYTDESRAVLETAIANVDRTKRVNEQAEVDAMAKAIEDAIAGLEVKPTTPNTETNKPGGVPTGDTTNVMVWTIAIIASLGLASCVVLKKSKKIIND